MGSKFDDSYGSRISGQGGIQVIPVQIERDSYGVVMVDTVGQTLWVYEINSRGPAYNNLRLLAARSWKYDRKLEDLNTASPKPKEVQRLLENLGKKVKPEGDKINEGLIIDINQVAEPDNNL
jgi:hypothetical protein